MWELTLYRYWTSPLAIHIGRDVSSILESHHINKDPLPIVVYGTSEDYHEVKGVALFLGKNLEIYDTDRTVWSSKPFYGLSKIY